MNTKLTLDSIVDGKIFSKQGQNPGKSRPTIEEFQNHL
jgi:hypothetical protein